MRSVLVICLVLSVFVLPAFAEGEPDDSGTADAPRWEGHDADEPRWEGVDAEAVEDPHEWCPG